MIETAYSDRWVDIYGGDCRAVMAALPAASVHVVVTSPPYFGLRDYGVPATAWGGDPEHEHEWGDPIIVDRADAARSHGGGAYPEPRTSQRDRGTRCRCGAWLGALGLEPTPDLYVEHLVEVMRAVRRVLRPEGTLWLNLGDSFASTSTYNTTQTMATANGWKQDGPRRPSPGIPEGLKPKDLIGVPWMAAFALRADGWWLRRDVIWSKPNGMPESVEDRPSSSHEYLFMLTASEQYFYDHVAVKEPFQSGPSDLRKMAEQRERIGGRHRVLDDRRVAANRASRIGRTRGVGDAAAARAALDKQRQMGKSTYAGFNDRWAQSIEDGTAPGGRNLRSVWTIATEPYPGAHFATYPRRLVEPCVKASTSERGVCAECGAPLQRVVEYVGDVPMTGRRRRLAKASAGGTRLTQIGGTEHSTLGAGVGGDVPARTAVTTGWARTCDHEGHEPVPATVLDPFAGSGTTGLVAQALGRRGILIDLNPEYLRQAMARAAREWGVGGRLLEDRGGAELPEDSLWAIE